MIHFDDLEIDVVIGLQVGKVVTSRTLGIKTAAKIPICLLLA
jgi:hypothetical protein